MVSLEGKAVIVTGASRGIGRAIAIVMAGRGARVACLGRDEDRLREVVEEITKAGGESFFLCCDVQQEWSVKRTVEDVFAQFDGIDILINNAAVGIHGPTEFYTLKNWRTTIDTNLTGPFLFCRAVVPLMKDQGSGRIINVASGAGKNGIVNMSAYCASKFGLIGFTQALGLELREHGIHVCTAIPGSTDTEFSGRSPEHPNAHQSVKKRLSPFEVAEAIAGLCESNANSWVSEVVIRPLRVG